MLRIASSPHPDHPLAREHEFLWLLVGGDDDCDGAKAFFLGPNRSSSGARPMIHELISAINRAGEKHVCLTEARSALAQYLRIRRRQTYQHRHRTGYRRFLVSTL